MKIEFREASCFCEECRTKGILPDIGNRYKHKDLIGDVATIEGNPSC
jgi:hypothetical protein